MANNNKKTGRSRRRGVRASRVKLTEALAAAGIKTQAALAERIADLEGLDAAPRDVVYRVFRQQPVDLNTLTRVARALDRPVHTLLLSSEEQGSQPRAEAPGIEDAPPTPPPRRRSWWLAAAAAVLVIGIVLWYAFVANRGPAGEHAARPEAVALRDLTDLAIVVRPFEGDSESGIAEALRAGLAPEARVASAGAVSAADRDDDAAAIAERLNANVVVEGDVTTIGRHVGARVFAWYEGERRVIWTTSLTQRALGDTDGQKVAGDIVFALRRSLARNDALPGLPGTSAQEAYLRGRYHLDRSRTELNVKRAITRFGAALRDSPDYARAYAGLCQALVQESVISSADTLQDAEEVCARAYELAPELADVRRAHAVLARRSGRHDDARQILMTVLEEDPNDAEALMEMAENWLALYRRSEEGAARAAAIDYAERANGAEPDFWKVPFTLARIYFFTGNVDGAIAAGEAAVAAEANEHSVTNLGTFYFCGGDHDQALDLYLRAGEIAPDASLGEEQMCVAYYFAREFDRAVASCKAAIDVDSAGGSPARHEMWGNLADAYRQADRPADAADAYARAAELAERALLTRGHSPNVRAHLAYYYTVLRLLDSQRVPDSIADKLAGDLTDLSKSATDPQAFIRIASAWALLGRTEEARAAYTQGIADCPGFGTSPDLDAIRP